MFTSKVITESCKKKDIGKPCAGKSHARFDEEKVVHATDLLYRSKLLENKDASLKEDNLNLKY